MIAVTIGVSAFISVMVAALIVRGCLGTEFKFSLSPASIICGQTLAESPSSAFRHIASNEMSAQSNVPEREDLSIENGRGANKLIDGSEKTLAAPGSNIIDYSVILLNAYKIKQIIIYWGDYGINPNYINAWSLEYSDNGSVWKTIKSGMSPKDSQTIINERIQTSRLRLKAQADKDWIGVYELKIIGKPMQ
jgi:F5/8 type C domain